LIIEATSDIEVYGEGRKVGGYPPHIVRLLLESSPTLLTIHIKANAESAVSVSNDLLDNTRNARLGGSVCVSNSGSVHILLPYC
jgi:hypothetical protein